MKTGLMILLLTVVTIISWVCLVALRKHETWVAPEIDGIVVQLEDEHLPIAGIEVIARNRETGDRTTITDESGKFSFPAILQMKRVLPEDPCYSTTVVVVDSNETEVSFRALICTEELSGSSPPTRFTLTFRLAGSDSSQVSRVDAIWQREGLALEAGVQNASGEGPQQ